MQDFVIFALKFIKKRKQKNEDYEKGFVFIDGIIHGYSFRQL